MYEEKRDGQSFVILNLILKDPILFIYSIFFFKAMTMNLVISCF